MYRIDKQSNSACASEKPIKDVGKTEIRSGEVIGEIGSDSQKILEDLYKVIGNSTTTLGKLEGAPPWIIERVLREEHDNNWLEAYKEAIEEEIPRDANLITSHVIYKFKTTEGGEHSMKARIFPHENKGKLKYEERKDSATAQVDATRLLPAMLTFLPMRLGVVNISGAYMQSGPINRDIFVRPPRE